jgi:IS5 family transposase
LVVSGMQKPFSSQPELFNSRCALEHPTLHALDDTEALLDWGEIEGLLCGIYVSDTGRPSYPLLTLFRGLLLGVWYRLSDVQLAQCLYRDLLFRKFCYLELGEDVPEASTLERFRMQLVEHDLWEHLLGEVNRQLEASNIIMTQGRINTIDATPVEAAQSRPAGRRYAPLVVNQTTAQSMPGQPPQGPGQMIQNKSKPL